MFFGLDEAMKTRKISYPGSLGTVWLPRIVLPVFRSLLVVDRDKRKEYVAREHLKW